MKTLFAAALFAATVPASPVWAADTAPVSSLLSQVNIPHQQFTLKNGLRVIVHTDRKAPVVAVSIWYDVGSKHEPKGKTGFAHLFEHLMFNGSENSPGDFFQPLQTMGATDYNGTTWFDRTNYFQTVPASALERTLWLESDRMGYLLGAVTQEKLDNQRGVVQNEKRQGDNQPYGLVEDAQTAAMVPPDHPYGHRTIGSMADLDSASMDDVRAWFRLHYGPNNAVLVLAGDVDVATAKPMVERWFGAIARGPQQTPIKVSVPTLPAAKAETIKDRVANVRLYRNWKVPGIDNKDSVALDVAASVLGGLASSRLDNALVREEKLAVSVTTGNQSFAQLGDFEVTVDVRPGVDPATAAKRLDEIIADLIKSGPSTDEVQRVVMRTVSGRIAGLEQVGGFGGKAVALAEGALYKHDSNLYKEQMQQLAAMTPATVKAAMGRWLTRPVYALTVQPGERVPYQDAKGAPVTKAAAALTPIARPTAPKMGAIADLHFPAVTHSTLSNGIELVYAQRTAVPVTQISISLDAGQTADPRDRLGTQSLMLGLMDEGAAGLSSRQIAEAQERLGATISARASMDRTNLSLWSLSANLVPSLSLFADIVQKPDFADAEVARLRNQQLARIAAELKQPGGLAGRVLPGVLFGPSHPYGIPSSGSGDVSVVSKLTRADMIAFHQAWVRPDKAKIFVVSNLPLSDVKTALERRFGQWTAKGQAGSKPVATAIPAPTPRIILIDRPDSPQSLILGGQVLPLKGTDDLDTLLVANENLGTSFLSRLNMDLRESKGWSYGVRGTVGRLLNNVSYAVSAPVQADKTGESIFALLADMKEFLGPKGTTTEEFDRTINGDIRELPGSFEQSAAVLQAMQTNNLYGRPDNYFDSSASRYRAMTREGLDKAIRAVVKPEQFVWVVVGDAKIVKPQLDKVGLPVEQVIVSAGN